MKQQGCHGIYSVVDWLGLALSWTGKSLAAFREFAVSNMRKIIHQSPVYIYLIMAAVSAASALAFFHLGGSLAELTGRSEWGFSFKAGGAFAGFLIVFWFSVKVIERLFGIEALISPSAETKIYLPKSYSFASILAEISGTIKKLEDENGKLVKFYRERGDAERLFDGLYSSLLYASGAAITGTVDSTFYGNLMEWDATSRQIRVRYFSGPYNDEIITRHFPIEGPRQGVASDAFKSGRTQVINLMASELKEKGESRLNAMISVPIPGISEGERSRKIVLLNIDSGIPEIFPKKEEWEASEVKIRLEQLANLISRVNKLYQKHLEKA